MAMMRVLSLFGTRPEAIKMAPVVRALAEAPDIDAHVCVSSQHREMLAQVLEAFSIAPDHDLDVMKPGQSLTDVTVGVLAGLERLLAELRPDWLIVQGDTTTAMAGALAGFYAGVKVGHVEAGLRTGDLRAPFPEEANRQLIGRIATAHWAPTQTARRALLAEGLDDATIRVTGNTVIDALHQVRDRFEADPSTRDAADAALPFLQADDPRRIILVTGHRRENFGRGMEELCRALTTLADRGDVRIVYPVHLNPNVREPVNRLIAGREAIQLTGPLGYLPFARLMARADLVITDSGGIQEEAPVFARPVLVTRDTTERPEAIAAGVARLVGADAGRIVAEASRLLDDPAAYAAMATAVSPFGDGRASMRILDHLRSLAPAGSRGTGR